MSIWCYPLDQWLDLLSPKAIIRSASPRLPNCLMTSSSVVYRRITVSAFSPSFCYLRHEVLWSIVFVCWLVGSFVDIPPLAWPKQTSNITCRQVVAWRRLRQWYFSFKIHFRFSFYKFFCQSFLFLYYISIHLNNYFSFYKFLYQSFLFYK